ncbi:MAG: Glu/Leu/Phe/Val dehydrogenase [Candidatus Bathyarchaeota archaeon]|nr:MAG: Glu/Leu/Phe/Val dehydrogenase [Candidatus Bathyarchaeota archaeon]
MTKKNGETTKPLLTCRFADKELDFVGFIVIDSTIGGRSCGGVRLSPKVTLSETVSLAKNMTLKYAFLGIPLGGAKVGIRTKASLEGRKRRSVFTHVGKILAPFVVGGSFLTGPDMGTSDEDIDYLLNAAKNERESRKHAPTPLYTSWTMLASAKEALSELGLKLDDSTVAIEGFGKIGSSAAKVFSENGARITAVSTLKGAIANSEGLDVKELLEMKTHYGDDIVNQYTEARKIAKNELLCSAVDIILPCAGPWTINSANADKAKAKIICPGANIPITREAEEILFNKKIISLPDFVSNSGGVLGAFMGSIISDHEKKEIIEKHFSKRVARVIQISREKGMPPIEVAQKIAQARFHNIKAKSERTDLKKQMKHMAQVILPRIYRRIFIKPRAKTTFAKMLHSTE